MRLLGAVDRAPVAQGPHFLSILSLIKKKYEFIAFGSNIFPNETELLEGRNPVCPVPVPVLRPQREAFIHLFDKLTGSCARDWGCKTRNLPSDLCSPMLKSLMPRMTSQLLTMAYRAPQNLTSASSDLILPNSPCFSSSSVHSGLPPKPYQLLLPWGLCIHCTFCLLCSFLQSPLTSLCSRAATSHQRLSLTPLGV